MRTRKRHEFNIRNLQISKGTYYVTLPVEYVREFGWRERQKLVVTKERGKLVVKDWKK